MADPTQRLHVPIDPTEPKFELYAEAIREMNAHICVWELAVLPDDERRQVIGSALLAQAAHYFRNIWKIPIDQFVQLAEEQYEIHDLTKPDNFHRPQ